MPAIVKTPEEGLNIDLAQVAPAAYLTEVLQSETSDDQAITAGFYKQVDGEVLEAVYKFDEFKFVLDVEGEFLISDETDSAPRSIKRGDLIYIKNGSTMKFETKGGFAKVFFVAKKPLGPPPQ
jgi:ethanolamine utilization protein EutQ (cupin superfamily)